MNVKCLGIVCIFRVCGIFWICEVYGDYFWIFGVYGDWGCRDCL